MAAGDRNQAKGSLGWTAFTEPWWDELEPGLANTKGLRCNLEVSGGMAGMTADLSREAAVEP
jgi:hypothetical protein